MNRRRFINQLLLGLSAPLGHLTQSAFADSANILINPFKKRLVLVELAGANDGLNTLVPFDNDHYHQLRPNIALSQSSVVQLNDSVGIHEALRPLMLLWEAGDLAWVQGLGYPHANRSHFSSIALWETAGDGLTARRDQGWMTHAIEHQLQHPVLDPHGISLVGDMDVFASDSGRWLSIGSAKRLNTDLLPGASPETLSDDDDAASSQPRDVARALVQQRLNTLDTTLTRLQDKVQRSPEIPRFQGGALAEQLRQVARLIVAGVDTPVYRVQLGGFDTHQNQLGRHARLMTQLGNSLSGFAGTLKDLGEWDNTVVMTYSEFGRRAAENSSGGTDHGTAAPHMVLGGHVNGGLYSEAPDLSQLPDGDPEFTMDYRALYRAMLVDALGAEPSLPHLAQFNDSRLAALMSRAG